MQTPVPDPWHVTRTVGSLSVEYIACVYGGVSGSIFPMSTGNICSEIKKESFKCHGSFVEFTWTGPSDLALTFLTCLMALQRNILLLEIVE